MNTEKAGRKAGSVQSKENRQCYETKRETHQFICDLVRYKCNIKRRCKIKLFLDNFKVLATHPSQCGETEVFEIKIYLVPGAITYKSQVSPLNPDQKEN